MPYIKGLKSSFPKNKYSQKEIIEFSKSIFPNNNIFLKMLKVYENSGVKDRYLVSKLEDYRKQRRWKETNFLFKENAINLLKESITKTLNITNTKPQDVGAIVVVNTTGVLTPSLDAEIINLFEFKNEIKRLPLFGFGCAGGVLGLNRGYEIYLSQKKPILVCNVELCSLTFRPHIFSKENIVSTALFGDGASSYLIDDQGDCEIKKTMDYTWKNSLDLMGWDIEDDGLAVVFDKKIPNFIYNNFPKLVDSFNEKNITGYILHPGGKKIIDSYKKIFKNNKSIQISEEILSEFGNVSSVSVLLVLERMIKKNLHGSYIMSALGPGFSSGLAKIVITDVNR